MFARILVPLDGSRRSERAVPYAAGLAKAFGGELILMHAAPRRLRDATSTDGPIARLTDLEAALGETGLQVRQRIVYGAADTTILETADEERADLIVMSTHGHGGLGRWLYGSVADEVLRHTTRPIVVISAACERDWSSEGPFRLLVPLDGSPLAETALGVAADLGQALSASLLLLRVVAPADGFAGLGASYIPAADPVALDDARAYLDGISTVPSLAGRTVATRVEEGDPGAKIVAIARHENIDLIVMATHGSSGLARLTMGSVATATLHCATAPMLLVRPAAIHLGSADGAAQPDQAAATSRHTIPVR